MRLTEHLKLKHDKKGLRLLFEQAKSSGLEGQYDLVITLGTYGLTPEEVHQVASHLLRSKEERVATETIWLLGSYYPAICNAEERHLIKQLATSKYPEIKQAAQAALKNIKHQRRT